MTFTFRYFLIIATSCALLYIVFSTLKSSPSPKDKTDFRVVQISKPVASDIENELPAPQRAADVNSAPLPPAPVPPTFIKESNAAQKRSFIVAGNQFLKDGKPFQFIAGTAHYWRRPPEFWEDTMVKLKALGLNAVQTYISWNFHEPEPGQYDFDHAMDIRRYFKLAHKHGLLVIVRPGPFINAEVDMGGFPYWLLRDNMQMRLRTNDPAFFKHVESWFQKLLPSLIDLLYGNGGPIAMVQIENEYGSYYACDKQYLEALTDLTRKLLGPDVLLYTTDGPRDDRIQCGRTSGTVTTVDFGAGANVSKAYEIFRKNVPSGPFMNSEFYPGWIDHWSRPWNYVPTEKVVETTVKFLEMKASFTLYPAVGGTNFGFTIGANLYDNSFWPGTTSYDFDAPISESGELTEKYMKLREVIHKSRGIPLGPLPQPTPWFAYGKVPVEFVGSMFDHLTTLCPRGSIHAEKPMSFEELKHPYGFVLYKTVLDRKYRDPALLNLTKLHDRAIIFVNEERQGLLSRATNLTALNIQARKGDTLNILVQSEGRVTVGSFVNDSKGILGDVFLQHEALKNWDHYPLQLPSYPVKNPIPLSLVKGPVSASTNEPRSPGFYSGKFKSSPLGNTFLKMTGWKHGYVFINGYNLGRYWPEVGPQLTLFVPSAFLNERGENTIQILELDRSPCRAVETCFVDFVGAPEIGEKVERKHGINA